MRLLLWVLCGVSFNFYTARCGSCSDYPSSFDTAEVRLCWKGRCGISFMHNCLSDQIWERVTFLSNVTSLKRGAFNNLLDLWFLNISGVGLQRIEPYALHDLPVISRIILRSNSITVIKNNVFQDSFAEYIDLSYNRIYNLEDQAFSKMSRLKVLKINNNRIKSINRRLFTRSPNIVALNFARNEITTLDLNVLLLIRSIIILDLNFNKIFNVVPVSLESSCSRLLLAGNNVESINFLGKFRIKHLNMAMNSVTRFDIDFEQLQAGVEFILHPNPLTCPCLREFEAMGRWIQVKQLLPSSDTMLAWKKDYPICVANAKNCSDSDENDSERGRRDYFREIAYHEIINYEVVDKHYRLDLGSYIATVDLAKHPEPDDF